MTQAESLFLSFGFLIDLFEFIMKTCAGLEQYFSLSLSGNDVLFINVISSDDCIF